MKYQNCMTHEIKSEIVVHLSNWWWKRMEPNAATKNPLIYENFGFIEFGEITMWKHDRTQQDHGWMDGYFLVKFFVLSSAPAPDWKDLVFIGLHYYDCVWMHHCKRAERTFNLIEFQCLNFCGFLFDWNSGNHLN